MYILLTAFKDNRNSSKVLLDLISSKRNVDELYLDNNSHRCKNQIVNQVNRKRYDLVIAFEQQTNTATTYVVVADKQKSDMTAPYIYAKSFCEYLEEQQYETEVMYSGELSIDKSAEAVVLEMLQREELSDTMLQVYIPSMGKLDMLKYAKICSQYLNILIDNGK